MEPDLVARLFDEWAARWARGERPNVREFLERAGDGRDELGDLIDGYLQVAPRREPDLETVQLVHSWMSGESPLVDLRSRRGLTRDAVVSSLLEAFGFGEEKRPFLKERYHELESGLLDGGRLSQRLVTALAGLLRTSEDVVRMWRPRRLEVPTVYRINQVAAEALETPTRVHAYDPEVDALFLSDE